MTARRALVAALLGAAALLLCLAACQPKEENTTVHWTQLPQPAGFFPGTQPERHNNAIDGAAFSPPAESIQGASEPDLRYFPSGMGPGILVFQTRDAAGLYHLYASYYNGASDLMPAVEVRGLGQDPALPADLGRVQVAFLRGAYENEGDAVMLVPRADLDTASVRLYYGTFDRTWWGEPAAGGDPARRYGFDTELEPVDLSSGQDVHLAGFLTEGFRGSARFPAASASSYDQGEPSLFLLLLWSQKASASAPERLHWRALDIGYLTLGAASEVPLDAAAGADAAVMHAGPATEMDAYDNAVFFVRDDGASSSDRFLLCAAYDHENQAFGAVTHLLNPRTGTHPLDPLPPCQAGGRRLYGSDEGLARLTGVFPVTGYHQAAETSLLAFQIDPAAFEDASGFDASWGEDLMEIDAGQGAASAYGVDLARTDWRMNRTGRCLNVVFLQDRSETEAVAALWAAAVRTYPLPEDRRPLSENVAAAARLDTGTGAAPVEAFLLPQDLGFAGFQAHTDRWTVAWKQDAASEDTLRWSGVFVDMSPVVPAPPTLAAEGTEGSLSFADGALDLASVTLTDGGRAEGGAFLYYVRDAGTGSYASMRAFQYDTARSVETNVGSLVSDPAAVYQPREALEVRVVQAPVSREVAEFEAFTAAAQHVFVREYRSLDSEGAAVWRHRVFFPGSDEAVQGDRFFPAADGSASFAPPVEVSAPLEHDAEALSLVTLGEAVAAFFVQDGCLFYNEFDPASLSWYPSATVTDTDGAGEGLPQTPVVLLQRYLDNPGTARHCLVLWTRVTASGDTRLFARIRK